ncbi:substrate-binding periplasmic protein [Chitinimonas naiadis]
MPRSLLILLLLLLSAAQAAENRLRLGVIAVAPYGYEDNQGKPDGAFYQLMQRLAQRAGLPADTALYPPARLYALMQHHQLDMAISSLRLDQQMGMSNLGKVAEMEGILLYRQQLPIAPKALPDFKPYLIGRLTNSCPVLQREGYRYYDLSDYKQGVRMLAAGRLDALCGDSGALGHMTRAELGSGQAFAPPFVFLRTDVYVFANPTLSPAVREKLANSMAALNREGETLRILDRYIHQAAVDPARKQP